MINYLQITKAKIYLVFIAICTLGFSNLNAQNLIANGDFATGDLTSW